VAQDLGLSARIPDFHALLALVAAVRGDDELCRSHAAQAISGAGAVHNRFAAAQATWALGLLATGNQQNSHASDLLSTLDVHGSVTSHDYVARRAAEGSLPFEQGRSALRRGEQLRRERRIAEARTQLRIALGWFEKLGAKRWIERARAELAAAGGPAAADHGVLTAQESRIADLAARGLSNREIGAQLFLSPRTVGYHLYKIFPKLGVSARGQLRDITLSGPPPAG
jgi:DNA-binding CsgD family transcriptional regulator